MSKVHLELGCGNNRRDISGWTNIGVDIVESPSTDFICNLGFESLEEPNSMCQIEESSVDLVQAYDLLEHIPKCVWTSENDRLCPLIFLINEVHRVLKDKGKFIVEVPFSDEAFNRDPTHVTRLSEDWHHYFQSSDNLYYDQKLVTANFALTTQTFRQYKWSQKDIMHTELMAIKSEITKPVLNNSKTITSEPLI
jgi:predicted SAM-dependent methyltransferase